MTTQMNQTRFRPFFIGLVAWIGLGSVASCSLDDQAPGGGRVEHPLEPGSKAPAPPLSLTPSPAEAESRAPAPSLAPPPTSTAETPASSIDRPRSPSETYEQVTGIKLSPLDRAIADDCPKRAWSKNVPKHRCTKDGECGDGFCDRGSCAPFWTCNAGPGQPCVTNDHCDDRPCIDGRCRSCISDAECTWVQDMQDPKCTPDLWVPGFHVCDGLVPSIKGSVAPGPPPQRPKQ